MAVQIQLRRGTAAQWTAANSILAQGEMGVETDTGQFKIGNGSTAWNSLAYGGLQGVVAATSPLAYDSGTQTVSITAGTDGQVLVYNASSGAWEIVAPPFAPLYFTENVQTANYTLALADVAKVVAVNSSSNLTLTVPLNSSVAFPLGTVINVYRAGTGAVTISGAAGVTVRNDGAISAQFGEVSLRKRGTDEWVLSGNVS
jgi:hypothetical protein